MTSASTIFDVIVLGSGPAGSTAAIYASRALLNTLIIGGNPSGGQLAETTDVENFPGFPNGVRGAEIVQKIKEQAQRHGAQVVDENVVKVSGNLRGSFSVETDTGKTYKGKTIIIATGASAKWIGIESEQKLRGKGVSACATCDAPFFKNKVLAVVGGGDASMEEAIYLTRFAQKVYLITRSSPEKLRASKIMLQRAQENSKIVFIYNSEVKEVLGDVSVKGLKIFNNISLEDKVMNDVEGLFVAIGHRPNTDFIKGFIELDENGYIKNFGNNRTSVEGVFCAGDVSDFTYRQAITASGFGTMAAIEASRLLDKIK